MAMSKRVERAILPQAQRHQQCAHQKDHPIPILAPTRYDRSTPHPLACGLKFVDAKMHVDTRSLAVVRRPSAKATQRARPWTSVFLLLVGINALDELSAACLVPP